MRSAQDILKGRKWRFHGIWLKEMIGKKTKTVHISVLLSVDY